MYVTSALVITVASSMISENWSLPGLKHSLKIVLSQRGLPILDGPSYMSREKKKSLLINMAIKGTPGMGRFIPEAFS